MFLKSVGGVKNRVKSFINIKRCYCMKSLFTKALLLMLSLCLMSFMTVAQGTIKGKIVDSQTKEPLVGATVMLEGTSEGVAADLDGSFTLKTGQTGKQTLTFRCVGYKELKKEVTLGKEPNQR